jgi:transcriptional regulator with XRE-family HTH domain
LTLKGRKSTSPAYPATLTTWGDHLRKKRLDAKLYQKEVANRLGADESSVFNWETNNASPSIIFLPRIIEFLGYMPYEPEKKSIGEKIRIAREALGLTQGQLAKAIQIDKTTLWGWEISRRQPAQKYLERLSDFFEAEHIPEFPTSRIVSVLSEDCEPAQLGIRSEPSTLSR